MAPITDILDMKVRLQEVNMYQQKVGVRHNEHPSSKGSQQAEFTANNTKNESTGLTPFSTKTPPTNFEEAEAQF